MMLRLALDEVSVKVRAAPVTDGEGDGEDQTVWAGVMPLATWPGDPVTHHDVPAHVDVPPSVIKLLARLRSDAETITCLTRATASSCS